MYDTIAAISTPFGRGGIGIIRISGSQAFKIAGRIFKGKKPVHEIRSHTINYGKIIEPSTGEVIDEVLLSVMKAPNTFTREDVVEINCHGGIVVLMRIMDLILREGASPAQPGEFTKRAFMNGRIDLSQAEAVIDIINAKTSESSRAAVEQLEGTLSARIKEARSTLIGLIAKIDVVVDYPEHDMEDVAGEEVYEAATGILGQLEDIIRSFERGRIIREGISAVIVGKPNVGKSSLLNELSGKNKAIVTDIPGTTRDIIEEYVDVRGIPVRIIDTAGIRDTLDPVERIGVEKAEKALEAADLVIVMLDVSDGLNEEDESIIKKVDGKKAVYILNKMDAAEDAAAIEIEGRLIELAGANLDKTGDGADGVVSDGEWAAMQGLSGIKNRIIRVSVKNRSGINEIEDTIFKMFAKGDINSNSEILLTNIRHKQLIAAAAESLQDAIDAYKSGLQLDFVTIDLRNAADFLGQITGESVSDDVINEIFSRFCVGK